MYAILYDDLYRLTLADHPDSSDEGYSYDKVGNRSPSAFTKTSRLNPLPFMGRGQGATSAAWSYNAGNQLTSDGTYTYTYDNNGNMITKTKILTPTDVTTYTYNSENQLTQIQTTSPANTYKYAYDGLGRRIQKDLNGTLTKYVYDNEDIIAEYAGTSTTPAATYLHGPGIDEPIYMSRGGAAYYYHVDGLGSITELTNSTGAIAQTYKYDAFGNILSQTGTTTNPFTYTGREYDSESGLYYLRNRYYDPRIGRFLQEDPIGFTGGNNFYVYTKNNPVNYTDPYGLYGTSDCSYYERQCEKYGGEYYCETARKACPAFNKDWLGPTEDPDPSRDDDYEGWQRCTRQCLQDCDQESNQKREQKNQCSEGDNNGESPNDDFWDWQHFSCHTKCYSACTNPWTAPKGK